MGVTDQGQVVYRGSKYRRSVSTYAGPSLISITAIWRSSLPGAAARITPTL